MATPNSAGSKRIGLAAGLVGLLAILAGFILWTLTRPKPNVGPDMPAVLRANSRGVGYMERFDFPPAVKAFEEVVQLAPDWMPGKINLGIALMNVARGDLPQEQTEAAYQRAISLFEEVLQNDPKDPHAHFCLGLIIRWRGDVDQFPKAKEHFEAVTQIDGHDAFAWYNLGTIASALGEPRERVTEYFRHAVRDDPYNNAALLGLHQQLRLQGKEQEASALLKESEALRNAAWNTPTNDTYYSDRGKFAQVISFAADRPTPADTAPVPLFLRQDKFQVHLAPGARWAKSSDFGTGPVAELRAAVRKRFGATMVVLDYNGDGKPDLLLLSAVVEDGKVRDLLLRNDGDGKFTDVTHDAGLAAPRPSLGCVVGDFDNDGKPDLFITGAGEQHLFRNNGKGGFEDVTQQAGLGELRSVCLGAAFVDIDQDSDLDLVVAEYAETPEEALRLLQDKEPARGKGWAIYLNTGTAPPEEAKDDPPALKPGFRRDEQIVKAIGGLGVPAVAPAVTDLDGDEDLDWLGLADGKRPILAINDRLLRFHRAKLPEDQARAGGWNGGLVLSVNRHARSDLLLLPNGRRPILLLHRPIQGEADPGKWFEIGSTDSPPLKQAQAIDLDLDGRTDVVALTHEGQPALLHNEDGRLVYKEEALGSRESWPKDLVAVASADFNCDDLPDMMVWSESQGLQLHTNQGNGNHGIKLGLIGHRRFRINLNRTNAEGFGTRVTVQAGDLMTSAEYTTLSAGLGQSLQPLTFGLGRFAEPDVIRLRWPDLSIQAEFNSTPPTACGIIPIDQENRKKTSCPILFTWNGQRYEFITDFLGAGSVGEPLPEGGHRPPRPEESVKIEAEQLLPRDGWYELKFAEPMDEITYLDHLRLLVLDHPADVRAYPDERFAAADPPASQDLIAFRKEIYPHKATDHRGRDVTKELLAWDRHTVDGYARRAWVGFAEEHAVTLDFGDQLARFGPQDRLVLCLAGWTDYAYPESIWAAHQAGVEMEFPVLERQRADGAWQKIADLGFPAGLPRMMTLDVTGKLTGPRCVLRIRTNLHIYWDQVFLAPGVERIPRAIADKGTAAGEVLHVTPLDVASARLEARGCMQEFSPDGKQPTIYDYDRLAAFPVNKLKGKVTRFGAVTELLRSVDDRFVIFGAGDELTVKFDARKLPPLPAGWKRSFVLRTQGYCKDSGLYTAHGDTVEPLPFRAMSNYPYGPNEHYPTDPAHEEYRRVYNTRQMGGAQR